MERTYIEKLTEKIGKEVLLKGWTQTVRTQGSIVFIVLRDYTGLIQCVAFEKSVVEQVSKLKPESVVEINGYVKEEKQAPAGYEVEIRKFKLLSEPLESLPIPVVEKSEEATSQNKRFDYRWIDLRKPDKKEVLKIWSTLEKSFRDYCAEKGYIEIHSPKIVITSTESGSELFEVNYFGRKAYLAQSPQLYKQMAMAAGLEKVFEVGPAFRADPSLTTRHLAEFTMYDVEISFIEEVEELIVEEEKMICDIFHSIVKKHSIGINKYFGKHVEVPTVPFPRVSFAEAKKILSNQGIHSEKLDDLSPEDERVLGKYIKSKYGHEFVFVYNYPTSGRAFYSMRYEDRPEYTKSFDLLYKGLEITSGAIREHRYDVLKAQIIEKGFKPTAFESYLEFFKYGCPPHGGFAPGPSRILMQMLEAKNVGEVTYIYRGVKRIKP